MFANQVRTGKTRFNSKTLQPKVLLVHTNPQVVLFMASSSSKELRLREASSLVRGKTQPEQLHILLRILLHNNNNTVYLSKKKETKED